MPVQQQMSSFAKRLGGRVAQANEEHKDKPVDTGDRRLPAGIRDGVARLSTMYTKEQTEDKNSKTPKGETFFRASAVVLSPEAHNGEKVAGLVTQVVIPLCDVPAKGNRKAASFSDNWFEFQNLFKLLGVAPCPETKQTDPTGYRTETYFIAAMKTLTDPVRMKTNPVFVNFSTRGWTPPATTQSPKPEPMVFEEWHGLAQWNGHVDPAAGVTQSPASTQPPPMSAPPSQQSPQQQPPVQQPTSPPAVTDIADVVAALVETAMNDPEGATEDGANASAQLEEMAWAAGWSKEQTAKADDWANVGDMALNPPTAAGTGAKPTTPAGGLVDPAVASKWLFAKRTKDGARLKDNAGNEFPPQEVEVVTVDAAAKTCTVKIAKDGKPVVDIRSKQPVAVKFEWLEQLPY